ncbi:putative fluoride ion transporter CrcB 1 [Amycolatopsis deserti]|uniref:Fluoride-specific ion channel FluC n=1 Tax=Amycolatopsis deserti TaxID=185696 RepID=A0ABQ3JDK7_9PSEU|nr:fluoride efflux transporter CrcB [Amycolatopsis deserti]GHF13101.1 putative fluoride ion transporter CrcB 1 [Amycolatopsis deserti]
MSGDPGAATTVRRSQAPVIAAVAAGGGFGALARYELTAAWPAAPGHFPWATFVINVAGCFLIGVLMVLVTEVRVTHRLVRPFLGVGVLGGFTTFSTYAVEVHGLLKPGSVGVAFAYLGGTLLAAMLAVVSGVALTRRLARR